MISHINNGMSVLGMKPGEVRTDGYSMVPDEISRYKFLENRRLKGFPFSPEEQSEFDALRQKVQNGGMSETFKVVMPSPQTLTGRYGM